MPPIIRPATPDDLDAVAALWRDFARDQARYLRTSRLTKANVAAVRAHFARLLPHAQVLVAEAAGRVGGYAAVVVNLPPLETHYASATLSDLYVAPEHRAQGWGKALLQACIAMVAERGLHALALNVAAGNDEARALYRAAGFRPVQETLLLPIDTDYVKFGPRARED